MLTIYPLPAEQPDVVPESFAAPAEVMLADGEFVELGEIPLAELQRLQLEQEQRFAKAIVSFPAGSHERALVTAQAYDTVCGILAAQRLRQGATAGPLIMGFDRRYVRLVLNLLDGQIKRGFSQPRLFEIGFGSGALLNEVRGFGYAVGGVEVSATMRDQAVDVLGERYADNLLLGNFLDLTLASLDGQPTVVFWNDVLEHVAPDEALAYVRHAYELLAPGGSLVTVSPNWLLRPSDVTSAFYPPRTTACGLHLKEYRLREVASLLKRAGFRSVATPLFATKSRLAMFADGGRWPKQILEPALDRLPVKLARLLCRGWAMSITVATK